MDYGTGGAAPHLPGAEVIRVREQLVGGFYAETAGRNPAAVKLDLVLRGLAGPGGAVDAPGLRTWHLAAFLQPDADADVRDAHRVRVMREHVRRQLRSLEEAALLQVEPRPGRVPRLVVRSDRGDGGPLDPPAAHEQHVAVPGALAASGLLAELDGPRLVAVLAALVGEANDPRDDRAAPGDGRWFRTAEWFATRYGEQAQTFPFATTTLKRGLRALREEGLVERELTRRDPLTGVPLTASRALYTNRIGAVARARLAGAGEATPLAGPHATRRDGTG